jgi:hypothetical protein
MMRLKGPKKPLPHRAGDISLERLEKWLTKVAAQGLGDAA